MSRRHGRCGFTSVHGIVEGGVVEMVSPCSKFAAGPAGQILERRVRKPRVAEKMPKLLTMRPNGRSRGEKIPGRGWL